MKKGLLRTLSAAVAISMIFCMSVVAFADVTTLTKTSYDVVNGTVTVTTDVSGANSGDQVAFLVKKQNGSIIWIDQKTANSTGNATSIFTANALEAIGEKVSVGTTHTATSAVIHQNDGIIDLGSHKVTWKIEGSDDAKVIAVVNGAEIAQETTSDRVTFYFATPADEKLVSITCGDVVDADPAIVGDAVTYFVDKDTEYTFTFDKKEITEETAKPTIPSAVSTAPTAENKTASVVATATNATEYGILVAVAPEEGEYDFSQVTKENIGDYDTTTAPIRKYNALGANAAGQFVIELYDSNNTFFVGETKYDACAYAVGSDITLGEVFRLN